MFAKTVRLKIYTEMDEPEYYNFKTEADARKFLIKTKKSLKRKNKTGFIDLLIDNRWVVEHHKF